MKIHVVPVRKDELHQPQRVVWPRLLANTKFANANLLEDFSRDASTRNHSSTRRYDLEMNFG